MTFRVAILGGYGNFGGYIARSLADDPNIALIICGRDLAKAEAFAADLKAVNPPSAAFVDIDDLGSSLKDIAPDLVLHTVGPFQGQDYRVARAAIEAGAHYCDLADARQFVCEVGELDALAKDNDVAVIAGASSVPCLTGAYLDEASKVMSITEVDYGISAAQQTNRGLGTAAAILSYVGKPFTRLADGAMARVFGWQGLHSQVYPQLGRRWFGYCDVPDFDLFPARYPTLTWHKFAAGHETLPLHFGTWLLSWGVRLRLLPRLSGWSNWLLKLSFLFDWMGSDESGFHMFIKGHDKDGAPLQKRHYIIARDGHGPNIPCTPAIVIARNLAKGQVLEPGARPCVGIVGLNELRDALTHFNLEWIDE